MFSVSLFEGDSLFRGREQAVPYRGRGVGRVRGRGGRLRGGMRPRYNDHNYPDYPTDYTQVKYLFSCSNLT